MTYEEAIGYIHGTMRFGSKLGLHNIGVLLDLLGNPQKKLRFVHVAGTNGKGSTVAFISSILSEAGMKTGVFTSPFIQRFTERIRIGNEEISHADLARITGLVKDKVGIMLEMGEFHPTEFEIVTAIAFQYYMEKGCDMVVLEVGLGGRYDSTNIIETPALAVITTINYDHMDVLGDTLPKIAYEKAGIIKQGGRVLLFPQVPEVEAVFREVCVEKAASLTVADFSELKPVSFGVSGQRFDFKEYKNLEISLLGEYQLRNASLALMAAELLAEDYKADGVAGAAVAAEVAVADIADIASGKFSDITEKPAITEEVIRRGLRNAKWPGRLEVLKNPGSRFDSPATFIIDGAHNAEGAAELKKTLDSYFPGKRITLMMGVLGDKDYMSMIRTVVPGCSRVITITPPSPRALPADKLAVEIRPYCNDVLISDTIEKAITDSICNTTENDVICAFGSLYYIGVIRELFGL